LSGRPSSINLSDPAKAERFRKLVKDWKAGITTIDVIADEFNTSTKTIRRVADNLADMDRASQTYRDVDKWEHLPRISEFEAWVRSRGNTPRTKHDAEYIIQMCRRIWEGPFLKKNLSLLTEGDVVNFLNWKDSLLNGKGKPIAAATKFQYILAMRLFMRFGYGEVNWLDRYLGTKGKKGDPRMPPEFKVESVFRTVMPRLYKSLTTMLANSEVNHYEYEAQHLVIHSKSTIQIRTGDHDEQRELWGIVINNPNNSGSNLLLDNEGKVQHLTAKCKGQETWEIPREAFDASVGLDRVTGIYGVEPQLTQELEQFIHNFQLKTGDYLIDPARLSMARSNEILDRMAELARLSDLNLHDMRKVSATSLILADVRIEDAINYGVGWKDAATFIKHYLAIKGTSQKRAYSQLLAVSS
jgi:hypothetical protein